jgi:hypothetical protein
MATPVKLYQQEMHNNLGAFATWFPGNVMELGDIGVFEGGMFRKVGALKNFEIGAFETSDGTPQNLSYSASAERKMGASAGVDTPLKELKGDISIRFTKKGGYVFEAAAIRNVQIADPMALGNFLMKIHSQGKWKREWLVVASLYKADSATIIVSEDSSSEIVLNASAAVPIGPVPLADPKIGLSVSSSTGRIVQVVAQSNLTPLYSCLRIKEPIFGDATVAAVRGISAALPLDRPGIGELLDS